jgi:hypothetical protein
VPYIEHLEHLEHLALRDLRAAHLGAMYAAILAGNAAKTAAGKRPVGPSTLHSVHRTARALLSVLRKRRVDQIQSGGGG